MLAKPELQDAAIIGRLEYAYDIRVSALAFLPVGNDARAWSYRVESNGGRYFLKLRQGRLRPASLLAPRFLRRLGVSSAVAPLPTTGDQLFARLDDYALLLYPFIEGESDWSMPLTADQWRAWGAVMRSIHRASVPPSLAREFPREVFGRKWLNNLARVEDALARNAYPGGRAELWRSNSAEIAHARDRYLALGARMASRPRDFALCHADIHRANIILDSGGKIHIVDWDEALLAPIERDLMFFVDDGAPPESSAAFLAGYGDQAVDRLGLAYYKYDWVVQELADYGERLFLAHDLGEQDLALARREFARLFAPDAVIARAQRADANLLAGEAETDAKAG